MSSEPAPSSESQAVTAYQQAGSELRFFKSQQWRVANYVLLVEAALATAPEVIGDNDAECAFRVAGIILGALGAVFGWILLDRLEAAQDKERKRMSAALAQLDALREIHNAAERIGGVHVRAALRTAIVAGATLSASINLVQLGVT